MKRFTLSIILFIASTIAFAQSKLTDSLKYLLSPAKEDTTRVLTIAELGLQFPNSEIPILLFIMAEKALARQIKFQRGEALALSNVGPRFLAEKYKHYLIG